MPIALAPIGCEMTVARVVSTGKDASHLAALGLVKDAKVTVLSCQGGSVVLLLRGSRLALDRQTAAKIFVA